MGFLKIKKMKANVKTLVAAMAIGTMACSCTVSASDVKEGKVNVKTVTETRTMPTGIECVETNSSADVHYTQGEPSIKVVAPANLIGKVTTTTSGNKLVVGQKKGWTMVNNGDDIDVYVSMPSLSEVSINGSGDFEADGKVKAAKLALNVNGSGDVDFKNLTCDVLSAKVNGSGDVDIDKLKARSAALYINGSGDIEATLDGVETFSVAVNGSGDTKLSCNDCGAAQVSVMGSGDVTLSGQVSSLNQKAKGSGDIYSSGLKVGK